jgi:hypothetical protein
VVLLCLQAQLKGAISEYYEATGSAKAKAILDDWSNSLTRFWQVWCWIRTDDLSVCAERGALSSTLQVVPPAEAASEFAKGGVVKESVGR